MIQTEDPLPTKFTFFRTIQYISRHFATHMTTLSGTAIGIVGCFLLLAPTLSAQDETIAPVDGRVSVEVSESVCSAQAQIDGSANALLDALCDTQSVDTQQALFAQNLRTYLAGHPMAAMADALAAQDPEVAAYLVAMAKQESNWGKRVPVLNGQDCFNYWGYRGQRARMGTGGHTCFDSIEDAVETVAKRVDTLVHEQGRTTPRAMLVWKCGSSCASHDPAGVERWVSVVSRYRSAVLALVPETPTDTKLFALAPRN